MCAGCLTTHADDYGYLTFETSSGTQKSVSVTSLTLTVSDGKLIARNTDGSQSFTLSELSSMFFSDTQTGVSNITGDANRDEKVTITDAVAVVDYILGNLPDDFNLNAADVSGDGSVNISDAVGIVDMILSEKGE